MKAPAPNSKSTTSQPSKQAGFTFVSMDGPDVLNSSEEAKPLDYQPTRYELLQLARHWTQVYIEEKCGMEGPLGVDPFRMERACTRLKDLDKVLGGDEVDKVGVEEIEIAGRDADYEEWHVWFYGTKEEMEEWNNRYKAHNAPEEPVFAVPAWWKRNSLEFRFCDLHNRLTNAAMEQQRETGGYNHFWLKYGPWECPDCHVKVYWALCQCNHECEISGKAFDTQRTAELVGEFCPQRTKRKLDAVEQNLDRGRP